MTVVIWTGGYLILAVAIAYVAAYGIVALAARLGLGYSWQREAKRHAGDR